MIGHADDALLYCIVAACCVVLAHGVDALTPRRRRTEGGNPVALALLGLAVVALAVGGLFAKSSTDVLVVVASCAAVAVSALPLTGIRLGGDTGTPPTNPWDRAYRIHPGRVAQLLSPRGARPVAEPVVEPVVGDPRPEAPHSRPGGSRGRTGATAADMTPGAAGSRTQTRPDGASTSTPPTRTSTTPGLAHHGVVITPEPAAVPATAPGAVAPAAGPQVGVPSSTPEVYEAEETLNDVTQVVGDLGRLLGLDRRPRRDA